MPIGRKPQKVTRFGADPTVKATWRFIRTWVTHNHKLYYTYCLLCAFGVYQFWWYTCVGYYRRRNEHRSLEWAIRAEKEYQANKPPEDDEEYGDEEEEAAEAAPAEGGDAEAEEEWTTGTWQAAPQKLVSFVVPGFHLNSNGHDVCMSKSLSMLKQTGIKTLEQAQYLKLKFIANTTVSVLYNCILNAGNKLQSVHTCHSPPA